MLLPSVLPGHVLLVASFSPAIDNNRAAMRAWTVVATGAFAVLKVPAVVLSLICHGCPLLLACPLAFANSFPYKSLVHLSTVMVNQHEDSI